MISFLYLRTHERCGLAEGASAAEISLGTGQGMAKARVRTSLSFIGHSPFLSGRFFRSVSRPIAQNRKPKARRGSWAASELRDDATFVSCRNTRRAIAHAWTCERTRNLLSRPLAASWPIDNVHKVVGVALRAYSSRKRAPTARVRSCLKANAQCTAASKSVSLRSAPMTSRNSLTRHPRNLLSCRESHGPRRVPRPPLTSNRRSAE